MEFSLDQLNYLVELCEHDEHRFDCPVCGQEIWRRAEQEGAGQSDNLSLQNLGKSNILLGVKMKNWFTKLIERKVKFTHGGYLPGVRVL